MSANKKIDFRKGRNSRIRTADAKKAILDTLSQGDVPFEVIRTKTGLSRPALASNLKWLHKHRMVKRRVEQTDYRVKPYSITDLGRQCLAKQNYIKNIEAMGSSLSGEDAMGLLRESVATLLTLVTSSSMLKIHKSEVAINDKMTGNDQTIPVTCVNQVDENIIFPVLSEKARRILTNCFHGDIDFQSVDGKPVGLAEALREILEAVNMVAESKDVASERLKNLPKLTFTFRFDSSNLILQHEFIEMGEDDFLKENLGRVLLRNKI